MADDPRESVPDELEERLDDLSATLTDDDDNSDPADSDLGTDADDD